MPFAAKLPNSSLAPASSRRRMLGAALSLAVLAACGTTSKTDSGPVAAGQYRVKPGDTLARIARAHNQSVSNLTRWNKLSNPNQLNVGQVLQVAPPGAAASSGASTSTSTPAATSSSGSTSGSRAPTRKINMVWPAEGQITRQFGQARANGITISNQPGTPVVAAAAGTVAYVGNSLRGYGNMLIIRHADGFLSVYAHNRKVLVKEGASVRQGQNIAEMGQSEAPAPALYFEVRQDGRIVDPRPLLPKR